MPTSLHFPRVLGTKPHLLHVDRLTTSGCFSLT